MPKTILAIGPHPDDIEFTIGGILVKEVAHGSTVELLVMSRGESSTNGTPRQRQREAAAAAKLIGAKLTWGDFGGDSHIVYSSENVIAMARHIRELRPDVVLANSPDANQHPDHVQAAAIVRAAVRLARYGGVPELNKLLPHKVGALYFYPATLSAARQPDIIVDISQHVSKWRKVLAAHKSQLKTKNYIDLVVARARVLGLAINSKYAQGLYLNDPMVLDVPSDVIASARNF